MAPVIEVVSGREHIRLETKGDLIATYVPRSTDLTILLDAKASDQKLADFKSDVKDLRNRKGKTLRVNFNSDTFGEVILNSFEIINIALDVRDGAWMSINKRD